MLSGVVSVVLPIYGVEKYLDRCINSVVHQSYTNLEIILVDDGSTDGCPQICDDWARKDPRIKVIHKINAGLGMARNTGIEHATGEYICFFDSDDYVALDTIEKAYTLAKTESADMVVFGLTNVDKNGRPLNSIVPETKKITYAGNEVQSVFLPDLIATVQDSQCRNLYMSACLCLYSMKMIRENDWGFASEREIISEDVYSLLCLYQYVNRVSVLCEPFYYYCENGASLSHTYRADRFERICHFYETSVNKALELGYSQEVIDRLQEPFLSFSIAAMKQLVQSNQPEKVKRQAIKTITRNAHWQKFRWIDERGLKKNIFCWTLRKQTGYICYLLLKLKGAK